MHQTRQSTTTKLPIKRKGTKYIAVPLSHKKDSVPIVIAVRDMLKLAKTTREVKQMINSKLLKLNGKPVKSHKESIKLFNILEADKPYTLTLSPSQKFTLSHYLKKDARICKVLNKKLRPKAQVQLNLHDGTNVLSEEEVKINDSVQLDFSGKIKSIIKLDKGSNIFVFSGKYAGQEGKVESLNEKSASVKLKNKEEMVELPLSIIIAQ